LLKLCVDSQLIQSAKDHSQSPNLLNASKQFSTRLRWGHANLYDYYNNLFIKLGPLLDVIDKHDFGYISEKHCICKSTKSQCSSCCIKRDLTIAFIDSWYNELTSSLQSLAVSYVPSSKPNLLKHWWNDEASAFKKNALLTFEKWKLTGKQKTGPEFD